MEFKMKYLAVIICFLYNLLIIFATGYIVFYLGFSGWWFLLTMCLIIYKINWDKND